MTELMHINERDGWEQAARDGEYRMSTRGVSLAAEGFIHCSLPHQLRVVAEAIYGEQYPHIYGPVPAGAVTGDIPVGRDPAGRLILPGPPDPDADAEAEQPGLTGSG